MTPHKKPIYKLTVDGENITATVQGRLVSLTLTDNRGFEADQLDIVLDDSDGKLDLPPRGALVHFSLGWQDSGLVDKGSYTVDEVSHSGAPDTLTIRARSADLRSGLTTQRERSWHCSTVGMIVNEIAAENELIPMISASLAEQVIDHLDQTKESSANLLTRLARMHDAIAAVKNGKLLFICAGSGVSASGKRIPVVTLTRQSGDSHHFSIADRETYTLVKATYDDKNLGVQGEVFWGKDEDNAESNRKVPPPAAVPVGTYFSIVKISKSRAAAHTLASKEWKRIAKSKALRAKYIGVKAPYNDRNLNVNGVTTYGAEDQQKARKNASKLAAKDAAKFSAPAVAIDHSADNIKTLRHPFASKDYAKRAARAEWRRLQRGMAEFSITLAHGQPGLIPEMPATVQGFKPAIDSTDWLLTKVTHTLGDSGYTTQLALEIKATEIPG